MHRLVRNGAEQILVLPQELIKIVAMTFHFEKHTIASQARLDHLRTMTKDHRNLLARASRRFEYGTFMYTPPPPQKHASKKAKKKAWKFMWGVRRLKKRRLKKRVQTATECGRLEEREQAAP